MEIKRDCFACQPNVAGTLGCVALKEDYCRTEECKFYKTKEQFKNEQKV